MKTAGSENPNRWATVSGNRAHGATGQEQILLNQVGCEERKIPPKGVIFFLTSTFIEQIRSWRVDRGIAFGNRRFPCRFRLLRLKPMSFSKAHSRHRKLLGGLLLLASVIGFGVALCLGCGPVSP